MLDGPARAIPGAGPVGSGSTAARWLRVGEAVLFLVLLTLGEARAIIGGGPWTIHVLSVVVAVAFAAGLWRHRLLGDAGRAAWIAVVFVGSLGLLAQSRDFLWLAFPLWMIGAQVLPLAVALVVTAVSLAVVITTLAMAGDSSVAAVLGPMIGALVAVGLSRGVVRFEHEASEHRRLLGEVLRAQAETEALADEVARAEREAGVLTERTRLAHDIHDTLAQGFSSIVLLARAAGREPDAERVRSFVGQIEKTASENLAESRRVVYALAADHTSGLTASLSRLATETADALGAAASLDLEELPRLDTATEVALLRAAQSALANVRRHSGARRIGVSLTTADSEIRLDVVDDGVGFDPAALPATPTLNGGYGLRAMRERLAALGGGLDIESEPGGGTAVSAHLPLTAGAGGAA